MQWYRKSGCVFTLKMSKSVKKKKVAKVSAIGFVTCWPGSDFPPEVKGNVRGDGYVFKMGVISLFLTKSGRLQLLLVQLEPWALPDTFLGKILEMEWLKMP